MDSQLKLSILSNAVIGLKLQQITNRARRRFNRLFINRWLTKQVFPFTTKSVSEGIAFPSGFSELHLVHESSNPVAIDNHELSVAFLNLPALDRFSGSEWHQTCFDDPLWLFNLHYHEWILELFLGRLAGSGTQHDVKLTELMASWIRHNPIGMQPGWHPYPISRRMVVWTRLNNALHDDPAWQEFWATHAAPSLAQQANFLAANLEYDLLNNHLIANFRALAWVGLLFPTWPGADRWRSKGLAGLWKEMRRQVLPDGVHDERSISYHTIVLQDLLETWWLATHMNEPVPDDVAPTIKAMMQYLSEIQTPNGNWPLLNDTVKGYPADPAEVLLAGGVIFGKTEWIAQSQHADPGYAAWITGEFPKMGTSPKPSEPKLVSVFPHAGYTLLRGAAGDYLFFDAGPIGPRRIPGHAHADTLGIVLYGNGRPLIVDPGVYSYHDLEWRDHFRSTYAHNTVTIDNQDQCVFWGKFRAAFLPKAELIDWSENHVFGKHWGYQRLKQGVVHSRRVEYKETGTWEVLDRFEGKGVHEFALTFQFAIEAQATLNGQDCCVHWPDGTCLVITCGLSPAGSNAYIESGWISPDWYIKHEAPRYVLRWVGTVPMEIRLLLKVITERCE